MRRTAALSQLVQQVRAAVRPAASVHGMPPPPEPGYVMPPPEKQLATFLFYKYPRADWTTRDIDALAVTHSPKLGIRHLVDDAFIGRVSVLLHSVLG